MAHARLKESFRLLEQENAKLEAGESRLRALLVESRGTGEKARREALRYRRECERLRVNSDALVAAAELQKAFVRKLESHVAMGATGSSLGERNRMLTVQLRDQDGLVEKLRERRAADKRDYEALAMRLVVAERALEAKLSKLGLSGSVKTTLLIDLARARQDADDAVAAAAGQSSELVEARREIVELRARAVELVRERHDLETQLSGTEVQLQAALTECERRAAHVATLGEERARMLRVIQRMAELEARRGELHEQQQRRLLDVALRDGVSGRGQGGRALLDALATSVQRSASSSSGRSALLAVADAPPPPLPAPSVRPVSPGAPAGAPPPSALSALAAL